MNWGTAIAVGIGLVVAGIFYLRTTPEQRKLQRARTQRIETSRPWKRGTLIMSSGVPLIFIVGYFTTGPWLVVALAIAFVLIAVGLGFMVKAMRAEPKVSRQQPTR